METTTKPNGLALLGNFGIALDTEIEGMLVSDAKPTNRKNTFMLVLKKTAEDDKPRKVFVGKKTIEEGLLTQEGDTVKVASGFETYSNNENEIWVRNKATALGKLQVIE